MKPLALSRSAAVGAVLVLAFATLRGERSESPPASGDVPREATAAAQLEHATASKRRLRGARGEALKEARRASVRAYRAVRHHFPDADREGVEAAFRAGELLRAGGDARAALVEFRYARDRGGRTPFGARAALEIGHLLRRTHRLLDALREYEAVVTDPSADAGRRDEAGLWVGRVQSRLGRPRDAVRAWQRVAERAVDALDRVRAFDAWASLLVREGDLEGAAGVLASCRNSLRERALEETRRGERVRAALESMRAVTELETAVEARARTRGERDSKEDEEGARATPPPLPIGRPRLSRFRRMGSARIPCFPPASLSGI